jgi:hypothetical protein
MRLRELLDAFSRFWWLLWTGHPDLQSVRRSIEEDARRFGGRVTWEDGR